jgi:hypothetical protein
MAQCITREDLASARGIGHVRADCGLRDRRAAV